MRFNGVLITRPQKTKGDTMMATELAHRDYTNGVLPGSI